MNTPKELRAAEEYVARAPGAGCGRGMSLESPNLSSLDRWAFEPRRVDKPWGWELIWALTDDYCGKVLFVKAGESLSLQYHEVKDESWYVAAGRAELELGDARRGGAARRS